jgi:hypothetical protein
MYHTAALPRVTMPPNLFRLSQLFLCVLLPSFQSCMMQSVITYLPNFRRKWCISWVMFLLSVNLSLGQAYTCTKGFKYSTEQHLTKTKTDYSLLISCLYFTLPNQTVSVYCRWFCTAFYTKFSITDGFHYIHISFKAGSTESTGRFLSMLTGSWLCASRRLVHCRLRGAYEFCR